MTNKELMKTYDEQYTVVGKSVRKLVKSVYTRCVGMEICITSVIRKRCLMEILELDYFS